MTMMFVNVFCIVGKLSATYNVHCKSNQAKVCPKRYHDIYRKAISVNIHTAILVRQTRELELKWQGGRRDPIDFRNLEMSRV